MSTPASRESLALRPASPAVAESPPSMRGAWPRPVSSRSRRAKSKELEPPPQEPELEWQPPKPPPRPCIAPQLEALDHKSLKELTRTLLRLCEELNGDPPSTFADEVEPFLPWKVPKGAADAEGASSPSSARVPTRRGRQPGARYDKDAMGSARSWRGARYDKDAMGSARSRRGAGQHPQPIPASSGGDMPQMPLHTPRAPITPAQLDVPGAPHRRHHPSVEDSPRGVAEEGRDPFQAANSRRHHLPHSEDSLRGTPRARLYSSRSGSGGGGESDRSLSNVAQRLETRLLHTSSSSQSHLEALRKERNELDPEIYNELDPEMLFTPVAYSGIPVGESPGLVMEALDTAFDEEDAKRSGGPLPSARATAFNNLPYPFIAVRQPSVPRTPNMASSGWSSMVTEEAL